MPGRNAAFRRLLSRRHIVRGLLGTTGAAVLSPAVTGSVGSAAMAQPSVVTPTTPVARLADVKSWGYQLQKASISELAASPFDLLVVDNTINGDAEKPLRRADVRRLQTRPGGKRRVVLAYVSIGEAEDYRFYWNDEWLEVATPDQPPAKGAVAGPAATVQGAAGKSAAGKAVVGVPQPKKGNVPEVSAAPEKPDRWVSAKAPPWLGDENETWGGNFEVKYWDPTWQKLMFGDPNAYLERVIAQGFDGLYLDRVDAYYNHADERPTAAADMADFVVRLAAAARSLKPDCIIVPQNAEELLLDPAYLGVIDGIAKEDLLYGSPTDDELNAEQQIANSLRWLGPAKDNGLAVLVVEYLSRADVRAAARTSITSLGFVPYFGPRSLDRLLQPDTPAQIKAAQAAALAAITPVAAGPKSKGQAQAPAAAGKPAAPKRRRR